MNLKTHTAYPEIQVAQAFDWMLADRNGRVSDPRTVPEGADVETVYTWIARIIGRPIKSMLLEGGGNPEDFTAPVFARFSGTADSREAAVKAATAEIDAVADDYIRPAEVNAEETA